MKHHLRRPLFWVLLVIPVVVLMIIFIPHTKDAAITPSDENECTFDSDCPVYRCPGVRASCVNGFCKPIDLKGEVTRCIDLKNPVCGNGVCEGNESDSCPNDCGGSFVDKSTCEAAGGHWNDCGSPCAGMDVDGCIEICEAHCECGGVAEYGYSCPGGYTCRLSGKKGPDEVGVCVHVSNVKPSA